MARIAAMTDTLKETETNGIVVKADRANEGIGEAGVSFVHSKHEESAVSEEGVSHGVEVNLVHLRDLLTTQYNFHRT